MRAFSGCAFAGPSLPLCTGKWILVTIGFHILAWDDHNKKYVHQFRPLVFLFSRNHESTESVKMAMDALILVGEKLFQKKLRHAGVVLDHADGLMAGMQQPRLSLQFATCWPHLARKFQKGELLGKSHPHYDEVFQMMLAVHLAHTAAMKELLESIIYQVWEGWENRGEEAGRYTTRQLWNEYFLHPWVRIGP